jgi:hypothetical protein
MKKILFTLCLAAALTGARGQIYIDSYRFGQAVSADLLLDSFPTAALAISFRKLDKDYTSNCITIQKDNGDTSNVAFSGNYLDTASVKSFCGTGAGDSCRVRVWFDQSGNARNFRQDTAANQPLIMIDGALTYDNGELAARFDGSNDRMQVPNSTSTFTFLHNGNTSTLFSVNRFGNSSDPNAIYPLLATFTGNNANVGSGVWYYDVTADGRNNAFFQLVSNNNTEYVINSRTDNKITPNQINILYVLTDADNATAANRSIAAVNGDATFTANAQTNAVTTNNSAANLTLANNTTTSYSILAVQEIVLYDADKSSDRTAIRDNINRFYSIY